MNAPVTSFEPYLSGSAPVRIGKVNLIVRDLPKVSDFYQKALGLAVLDSDATRARLGTGSGTLLELKQDANARLRSRREASLFHTAFLLPSRSDLAAWIIHASTSGLAVQGASDHLVSEAIYLADPEGNGIEIYSDRPHRAWPINGKNIEMPSDPLNIEAIVKSGDGRVWSGAPARMIVGHIHLQVGDIARAEAFYAELLGFDVTYRVPGATFYATGGYHHHLATNVWNSRGSAPVRDVATGLSGFELVARDDGTYNRLVERLKTASPSDPWGTSISIVKG
jgi:catechol 2,3-dioxygenase